MSVAQTRISSLNKVFSSLCFWTSSITVSSRSCSFQSWKFIFSTASTASRFFDFAKRRISSSVTWPVPQSVMSYARMDLTSDLKILVPVRCMISTIFVLTKARKRFRDFTTSFVTLLPAFLSTPACGEATSLERTISRSCVNSSPIYKANQDGSCP